MLDNEALVDIDSKLFNQRFPHNMSVKFNYPLNLCNDWKVKHFRVFVLSIGLPCILSHLPSLIASHFALYLISYINCCRTASQIYGKTIKLFSLHRHLHLPQQVLTHGEKGIYGTRELATQIADWINIGTTIKRQSSQLSIPIGVNSIDINNSNFDQYRHHFLNVLPNFIQNDNDIILFLRYKDIFVTYHSRLYDLRFNCSSYIVFYKTMDSSVEYGQIIIFFKHNTDYYGFVQEYTATEKNINDYVFVPAELKEKLNEIFPASSLSQSYRSIREQNKTYRITVERTDTLIEMEQLAQEAEELSTYKMNSDVVSDTEEWFNRKKNHRSEKIMINQVNDCKASFDYIIAYIFTIHFLDLFDKQLTELHTLDLDVYRTYTTLNTCLFDEPNKAGEVSRISSDKDDDDESSCDEDQEAGKTADGHILNSTLNCIPTSKSKKRTSSRVSRRIPEKRDFELMILHHQL
ncbi:unnamed protein product [Rotaria socialis]|uniref:Uncharacterized protein n=1 Tax=Rotaria socialis TaxID=392032 RepID=A0A820WH46_9BILA|nr:unnamed protein product [Rotaria socialis]